MDWLLPYYWAVGLSASGIPMTSWGLISLPLRDPDGRCADPIDLDVELVLVLYEVLVERAGCGICGAPLNPAVNVELARRSFTGGRIVVVATRCCGSRRHRQVAKVVERNGELRFGRFEPRNWLALSGHREART
jgi:hypothetical protein